MLQTPTLEERVAHVEQDVAELKSTIDRLRADRGREEAGLPPQGNPWLEGAGIFRDDPFFDDWQQAIAEYRREAERGADAP